MWLQGTCGIAVLGIQTSLPILISGAGIAGLTSALALAGIGKTVRVLEKAVCLDPIGSGLQLSPNAWHVLSDLGLSGKLEPHTSFPCAIKLHDGRSGNLLSSLPLGQSIRLRYGEPYGVIHRGDLQMRLLERCLSSPRISVEFDAEVVNATQEHGGIQLGLKNETSAEGAVLIAADGIWSSIRTRTLKLPAPVDSGKLAWRGLLPAKHLDDRGLLDDAHVWLAPNSHAVTYPVSGGEQLNLVFITDATQPTSAIGPSTLDQGLAPELLRLISRVSGWTAWPLLETPMPYTLANGLIALAGDAAHGMLPFAAQGAAMGIEDAAVLAQTLGGENDVRAALKAYQQKRCDRVQRVARFARSNGNIYHLPAPFGFFRNIGMRVIPNKQLMARQDWIYGWKAQV